MDWIKERVMTKLKRIVHWERIGEIHQLCRELAVSFSLNYSESTDTWCFSISSAAKNECYNEYGDIYWARFDDAANAVTQWLNSLLKQKKAKMVD